MVLCDAAGNPQGICTAARKMQGKPQGNVACGKFTTADVVTEKAELSLITTYEAGFIVIINVYIYIII